MRERAQCIQCALHNICGKLFIVHCDRRSRTRLFAERWRTAIFAFYRFFAFLMSDDNWYRVCDNDWHHRRNANRAQSVCSARARVRISLWMVNISFPVSNEIWLFDGSLGCWIVGWEKSTIKCARGSFSLPSLSARLNQSEIMKMWEISRQQWNETKRRSS